MSRHEALRVRFQRDGSTWTQSVRRNVNVPIHRRVAQPGQNPLEASGSFLLEPWNVTNEAMLRCAVVSNPIEKTRALVVAVNHLVCDLTSVNALAGDVKVMLHQFAQGGELVLPDIETSYAAACERVHQKQAGIVLETREDWRAVCATGSAKLVPGAWVTGTVRLRTKPVLANVVRALTTLVVRWWSAAGVAFVDLMTAGRPRDLGLDHTIAPMNFQVRYHLKEHVPLELDFDDSLRRFLLEEALEPADREVLNSRTIKLNVFAAPLDDAKDVKLFNDSQSFLLRADEAARSNRREPEVPAFAAWVEVHVTSSGLEWRVMSHLPELSGAAQLFARLEAEL
jgi:hypothetical protein